MCVVHSRQTSVRDFSLTVVHFLKTKMPASYSLSYFSVIINAEILSSPVFEMIYERNPARCKFERRLEVKTSPLNIIYNPQPIKKVTEFFYKGRVHTSGKCEFVWMN